MDNSKLDGAEIDRYLHRLDFHGVRTPDLSTLAGLQLAHMISVPFENLHVVGGWPMPTDTAWSLAKIVDQHRGGWCFELNGSFAALLAACGFAVTLHSAQVWDPSNRQLGPPLDHLCLVVVADGARWLVDVGFGDSVLSPVQIDDPAEQPGVPRAVRVEHVGGGLQYLEASLDGGWDLQYVVDLAERDLAEFRPRSDALARGTGGGHFRDKPFATRALGSEGERVWLLKDRLKQRSAGTVAISETPVSVELWTEALASWFGLTMPAPPP